MNEQDPLFVRSFTITTTRRREEDLNLSSVTIGLSKRWEWDEMQEMVDIKLRKQKEKSTDRPTIHLERLQSPFFDMLHRQRIG